MQSSSIAAAKHQQRQRRRQQQHALLGRQPHACLAWLNTVEETRQVGRPSAAACCAAACVSSVQMTCWLAGGGEEWLAHTYGGAASNTHQPTGPVAAGRLAATPLALLPDHRRSTLSLLHKQQSQRPRPAPSPRGTPP